MAKQFKKSKEKSQAQINPPKEIKPVNLNSSARTEPRIIWIFLMFIALSMVLYGSTIQNKYSMDDELVTLNQTNVELGIAGIPKILTARYSVNDKQHYEYRPIALVTFAIEYQFFGRDPAASHFINILFYALTCLVVYLIIKKIFIHHHWILPLLTALLFLIHPMHSEVAASLKNRDEMLALIFALLTLDAFINFAEKFKWKYVFFGFVYFMIALFSKKSAMPFIAIIPMVIIFTRNVKPLKVIGLTAIVVLSSSLIGKLFLSTVLGKGDELREMFFFENPLYSGFYGLGERLMMAIATFGYYVKMMFVPYPLVSYYGYNTFDGFHFGLDHIIGIIAGIVIVYLTYKYFKSNKPILIGLIIFCVGISMFINLFVPAVGIVAERSAFEPSLGFCLVLASVILLFSKSFELKKNVRFNEISSRVKMVFIALTLLAAIVIIPRNKAWYNTSTLYHTDAKSVPTCTKLYSLLGTIHANLLNSSVRGDTVLTTEALTLHSDTAISYFKRAIEIFPDYIAVNNNLGTIYFTYKTNLDSAGYYFQRACDLDTDYVEAYFNLGNFYDQRAEFSVQNLLWLNAILNDGDTSANENVALKESKILSLYDELFLKLTLLKTQFNTVFEKFASGKGIGDPKGSVLDAQLYYFKQMKLMKDIPFEHMALADGMIDVYKKSAKNPDQSARNKSIDSIVNKYYYKPIKAAILKDGKLKESDLNSVLKSKVRGDLRKYRVACIFNLKKSMRLNKGYMTAYTKLTQVLTRWGMYDELINTHKFALNNPTFKNYSTNFNLADAYFAKGDYKAAANYMIAGLKELQIVNTRINLVFKNFEAANSNFVLSVLSKAKENDRAHVSYFISKFMYQISNRYPNESVQIQQLYNMINTL